MRKTRLSLSLASLIAANLVPLVGVLFLGWDAAFIVLLYWTENIVIGFYSMLKIALLRVEHPLLHLGKFLAIPFFTVHFGGFCAVHGIFLLEFFKLGGETGSALTSGPSWVGPFVFVQLLVSVIKQLWQNHPAGMQWPVLGLLVSHGISFFQNFVGKKEYAELTTQKLMAQPYRRIVVMHLAIIAGAIPIMLLESPATLLCILVLLKIGLDVHLHLKERRTSAREQEPENTG